MNVIPSCYDCSGALMKTAETEDILSDAGIFDTGRFLESAAAAHRRMPGSAMRLLYLPLHKYRVTSRKKVAEKKIFQINFKAQNSASAL